MTGKVRSDWVVLGLGLLFGASVWLSFGQKAHADEEKKPKAGAATLVTDKNAGKIINLPEKEHLFVSLEFNAGTGHFWMLKAPCKELALGSHFVVMPVDAQPIGGMRLAWFDFRPQDAGTCKLVFDLVGPDGKPAQTVTFTVIVGKAK